MKAIENRVPPPLIVLLIGGAMWCVARYSQHVLWPNGLRMTIVVCLFVAGVAFGGSGFRAFARARTTIDPVNLESASVLVTGGIFRVSRNPMYVGFAVLLAAWAIWLQAPWALAGVLLFVAFIQRFQIIPEERVLTAKFGASYDQYRERVRRWL
jgi:protein-S-isoprenylcysteine O-methyltransferase Ste14